MKKEEFLKLAEQHPIVPVYKTYEEDLLTPISIYSKLISLNPSYILESVGDPTNLGRYSFIGLDSQLITKLSEETNLDALEKEFSAYKGPDIEALPPYYASVIGYMAYNAIEDIHPMTVSHEGNIPKYQFLFSKRVIAFDHLKHELILIYNCKHPTASDYDDANRSLDDLYKLIQSTSEEDNKVSLVKEPITFKSNFKKDDYFKAVERAKQYIAEGDIFQVVLSQKFSANVSMDGFELYRNLRKTNPAPYLSYIKFPEIDILCSSPEMLVRMNKNEVETAPIAGTRAVKGDGKDHLREEELSSDTKDIAEHLMLVDLGRNDIGKISKAGSVKVPTYCEAKRFSKVMHLVSSVRGQPREEVTPIDSLKATFPAGTVSGAPKVRALEIIDELEPDSRDLYAGSIVMLNQSGQLNSCISIRTIQLKKDELIIQAGGGIVYDSLPEHEYKEIINKASALFNAVEKTYEGEISYDFDYR